MSDFISSLINVFVNITRTDVQVRVKRGDEMITVIDTQWFDEIKSGVCILQGQNCIKVRCCMTIKHKQISILMHFFYCTCD